MTPTERSLVLPMKISPFFQGNLAVFQKLTALQEVDLSKTMKKYIRSL